ncbi:discoidin domain-containing protein [Ructibacterium gallinarum]|uniref:Discoidin domain-containing protein n=1 Tax=Ructibacterium gallinarum TaxID=2779355 RepID=A0A9D5R8W2_9FIRM|nr:discoidin domain-containing protein [Ructibacterium gallinarum]MBE5040420.1 discoidin domain-containing protein [Ructibacterium gallinarum]
MQKGIKRIITMLVAFSMIFSVSAVWALEKNIRPAGIVDQLSDLSKVKTYENVKLSRQNGVNALECTSEDGGFILYKSTEDINQFYVYYTGDSEAVTISLSVEEDGTYRTQRPEVENDCISMQEIKGKNRFLKITLQPGASVTGVEVNTQIPRNTGGSNNVLIDEFADFSKMYSYDPGFALNTDKPEEHGGDATRVVRGSAQNGASIIYQTPDDISAIRLKNFFGSARGAGTEPTLKYYLSSDAKNWQEIQMTTTTMTGTGLTPEMNELLSGIPAGMRYFKIEFSNINENTVDWSPKLGRLELYYGPLNTALEATEGKNTNVGMETVTVPTSEEIIATFKERKMEGVHPRLVATEEDFERIRANLGNEPYSGWFASLSETCEKYFEAELVQFVDTNVENEQKDFLTQVREIKARLENLAMMWKLTGDERYAERAYEEMVNAMDFPTLYPEHYLNVGEGVFAFAVAYDWMYDWMTPQQRKRAQDGIRKQLDTGYEYMMSGTYFTQNTNNWNGVCCGGLAVAAIAIMETDYEYCADIVSAAVKHTPKSIAEMGPDGVYPEGPGYWAFGTQYLVYMMSAMDHVLGQDYGLSQVEGFDKAGDFLLFISSPSKNNFNFADSSEGIQDGPQAYWFAEKFNNPVCSWYQMNVHPGGGTWDMIYYNPDYYATPEEVDYPLDSYRGGAENFSIFRSSFEDTDGLYAAIKGGDNQSSHGDLDIGTFVFDALGQRWASELGAENYYVSGYWDTGATGARWNYYGKRAEGHNTLVINPDMDPDQDPLAVDEITDFVTVKGGGYTILDMSNAYAEDASSVRRGMMVFDSKQQVLIQDEVECYEPSELYWSMHTMATVDIAEDGKTAILTRSGEKCLVTLQTPADAVLEVRPASPIEGTPNPEGNATHNGMSVLSIHLTDVQTAQIRVILTPLYTGEIDPNRVVPEVADLDDWIMEDMEKAELSSLTVDGVPVEEFAPNKYVYTIQVPDWVENPIKVEATTNNGTVEIDQQEDVLGQTLIHVTPDQDNVSPATYAVRFVTLPVTALPEDTPTYTPVGVKASDVPEPENVPENTLDGDYDTRWAAEGDQWIRYDLGEEKDLGAMGLSFMSGNERTNYFSIDVSSDDENWTTVWEGETSGTTDKLAAYIFSQPVRGRYIRFFGHGNSSSGWNSVTEAIIYGKAQQMKSFTDITECWAKNEIECLFTDGLIDGFTTLYYRPENTISLDVFADWAARVTGVSKDDLLTEMENSQEMSRLQAAMVTAHAADLAGINLNTADISAFTDIAQMNEEQKEAISKLVGSEIMKGTSSQIFAPAESLTRAQAAVILYRLQQFK